MSNGLMPILLILVMLSLSTPDLRHADTSDRCAFRYRQRTLQDFFRVARFCWGPAVFLPLNMITYSFKFKQTTTAISRLLHHDHPTLQYDEPANFFFISISTIGKHYVVGSLFLCNYYFCNLVFLYIRLMQT